METATSTKIADLTDDKLVEVFVQLRDRRSSRKKEFEAADSNDKTKQERIEGVLLQRFNERGAESSRTAHGTAYKSEVAFASIADWDALLGHIREKDAY